MLGFSELSYAAVLMLAYQKIRYSSEPKDARAMLVALLNGTAFEGLADGTKRRV